MERIQPILGPTTAAVHLEHPATVFFDGGCPVCRREIDHYRRLSGSEKLQWIDITRSCSLLDRFSISHEAAMARLHVLDGKGNLQVGAWAFAEIWSQLPGYRWLARSLRFLRLLPLLDSLYSVFARWRQYRRCKEGCPVPGDGAKFESDATPGTHQYIPIVKIEER